VKDLLDRQIELADNGDSAKEIKCMKPRAITSLKEAPQRHHRGRDYRSKSESRCFFFGFWLLRYRRLSLIAAKYLAYLRYPLERSILIVGW
jgi:hypothetical protein